MNSNYSNQSLLLEKVLEGKSEDFKRKVWDLTHPTTRQQIRFRLKTGRFITDV